MDGSGAKAGGNGQGAGEVLPGGRDVEVELKFALSPADVDHLAATEFAGAEARDITSIYYDTPDRDLRRAELSLRLRRQDGQWRQTLKGAGPGAVSRHESEHPTARDRLDLSRLAASPAAEILGKRMDRLAPVFETRVRRRTRSRTVQGSEIELALDEGEIIAGAARAPVAELEIELKSGNSSALFAAARRLAGDSDLRLAVSSKADRGYALADDSETDPMRFKAPRLTGDETAEHGFRALAFACLRQLDSALTTLWKSPSQDATHRARVALRRLRVFVGAFEDMLSDDEMAAREADLRRLADIFADARNLDVFIAETFRPLAKDDVGMASLGHALLAARSAAHERVRDALRDRSFGAALLDLTEWIVRGDWAVAATTRAPAARALDGAARDMLHHRRKVILKRGETLDWEDPFARHKLRIQAKKMRYLAEAFAFIGPNPDRFIGRLEKLQDSLGELNDIAVGPRVITLALTDGSSETAFAAGRLVERQGARAGPLLREARRRFARFEKAPAFWS
jgi:inorganic triphosphatase YgiF